MPIALLCDDATTPNRAALSADLDETTRSEHVRIVPEPERHRQRITAQFHLRVRVPGLAPARRIGQPARVPTDLCPHCGRRLDEHNRHLRFVLPEPVLEVPVAEREARTWGNEALMQVQGVGAFVRVLVPIHLTGGYTVTFGAWLGVDPDDLGTAYEVWWTDAYADLVIDGRLANMLPPWETETYGKPMQVAVRNRDEVPYAVSSIDEFLQTVLTKEWPHEDVLAAVARYEGA